MYGKELALGNTSLGGRLFYALLGLDHMGQRVRAFHVMRLLKKENINPVKILDAGCGDGMLTFSLSRRYKDAIITGVDFDADLFGNCKLILSRTGQSNISFRQADLVSLNGKAEYDLIICIDVLEHIQDDQQALKNLFAALNDEGVAIIHVPRNHKLNKYYLGGSSFQRRQSDHVRDEYIEEEIVSKIEAAGFKIMEKRYTFGFFGSVSRELFYKIERLNSRVRFLAKLALFPLMAGFAFLDTKSANSRYQGYLFKLMKPKGQHE
jgi:2-polyprenyl-3-methyl-5-hydroxy-6-metoxy-1,4-benzoquinol methylase